MSLNRYVKKSEKVGKSKSELIILYLSRAKRATTAEIANCLGCSPNTARKWLYRLEEDGSVIGKPHFYHAGIYLIRWKLA